MCQFRMCKVRIRNQKLHIRNQKRTYYISETRSDIRETGIYRSETNGGCNCIDAKLVRFAQFRKVVKTISKITISSFLIGMVLKLAGLVMLRNHE